MPSQKINLEKGAAEDAAFCLLYAWIFCVPAEQLNSILTFGC